MKLTDILILLAMLAGLAIYTVYQQLETVRLGYRIAELHELKKQLEEKERALRQEISNFIVPHRIIARGKELGLKLTSPDALSVLIAGKDSIQRPTSVARR